MRSYKQLKKAEKEQAVNQAVVDLLTAICEGAVRFNDKLNHDDLQARIDKAFHKAEQMQTPWFAHEYIMDICADEIRGMAQCDAEDARYPDRGEKVIRLAA